MLTIFSENLILPFEARCAQGRKEKAQPCRAMSLHPRTHPHSHTQMRPHHTHTHAPQQPCRFGGIFWMHSVFWKLSEPR